MVVNSEGAAGTHLLVSLIADVTSSNTEKSDTDGNGFQSSLLRALQHSTSNENPVPSADNGVLSDPKTAYNEPHLQLPVRNHDIKSESRLSPNQSGSTDQTPVPVATIPTLEEATKKTSANAVNIHSGIQSGRAHSNSPGHSQTHEENRQWSELRTDSQPASPRKLPIENQSQTDKLPLSSAMQRSSDDQDSSTASNRPIAKNHLLPATQPVATRLSADTSVDAITMHRTNDAVKTANDEYTQVFNKTISSEPQTYFDATSVSTTDRKHAQPIYQSENDLSVAPMNRSSSPVTLESLNHSYVGNSKDSLPKITNPPVDTQVPVKRSASDIDHDKTVTNRKDTVQSASVSYNSTASKVINLQDKEGDRVERLSRKKTRAGADAAVSPKQIETTRNNSPVTDALNIEHKASPVAQGVELSKATGGKRLTHFEPTIVPVSINTIPDHSSQIGRIPTLDFVQTQTLNLTSPTLPANLGYQIQTMLESGIRSAHIQVNPAELGPVKLDVAFTNDQLAVNIAAAHLTSRDLLEQSLPRLRELLQAQGFEHVDVDIEQHTQKENSESNWQSAEQNNQRLEYTSSQHSDTKDNQESFQQSSNRSNAHGFDAYA